LAAHAAGRKDRVRLIDSYTSASPQALAEVQRLALKADLVLVPSQFLAGIVKAWGGNGSVRQIPYAYDRIKARQIALVTMRATRQGFPLVACSVLDSSTQPGFELLFPRSPVCALIFISPSSARVRL